MVIRWAIRSATQFPQNRTKIRVVHRATAGGIRDALRATTRSPRSPPIKAVVQGGTDFGSKANSPPDGSGVRELVIGVPDIEREIERWQALLDPAPALGAGHWQLPSGPAIRLESSFGLSGRLICEVKDIEVAAAFLREQELLGNSTDDELQIAPAALAGLDLRLVPA